MSAEHPAASRRVQVDIIGDRDSRVSTSSEAGSLPDNKEGRDGSREGSGSDAWSSLEAGRERNRKAAPSDPGSTAACPNCGAPVVEGRCSSATCQNHNGPSARSCRT